MCKEPLITVITVCLNAGDDLEKTVKSVLNQNYRPYEYIIKDGLSNDGSISNVPKDPRIKIIKQSDNGIFDAMNQALDLANGKYVNFLNAGDIYYDTGVLQSLADSYKRNHEVEMFYGNFFKYESKSNYITVPKKLSRYYVFSNSLCHQVWFLSRKLQLKEGGYSTETKIGGDYLMLLNLVIKKGIKTKKIDKFLVKYKGGGVSANKDNIIKSKKIRNKKRKELFGKTEYFIYKMINNIYLQIINIFYDKWFYKIIKYYKHKKYS